jgi:hypothetical protein
VVRFMGARCQPWLRSAVAAVVLLGSFALRPLAAVAGAESPSAVVTVERPSSLVFGASPRRIVAAHRTHHDKAHLGCVDCHTLADQSQGATDDLGPSSSTCERCHPIRHARLGTPEGEAAQPCKSCHLTSKKPSGGHVTFAHARHLRRHIGCAQCHGNVERRRDAKDVEFLPQMERCRTCHAGRGRLDGEAQGSCITCHESTAGVMKTRFREGRLTPSSAFPAMLHDETWNLTHAATAGNDPHACQACHHPRECSACHDGRLRPRREHPGDWLSIHQQASKQQAGRCTSCHREQSFCIRCHQRVGVTSSGSPAAMASRGAMHPPGASWVDPPVSSRHHSVAARRNLQECTSCHQEGDCVRCHATRRVGGAGRSVSGAGRLSPHPAGFAHACRGPWTKNPRSCLACHRPDDPQIGRCQ